MLSELKVKNAKPAPRDYRLPDGEGLFLFVTRAGGKFWRLRYKFDGKEKTLTLGEYPEVSISDARRAKDAAKKLIKTGRDPSVQKRMDLAAAIDDSKNTFEVVARAWHVLQAPTWSEKHAKDVIESLEDDVFPDLGHYPIREIAPRAVLRVLKNIEERPATETARRVRQRMSSVFVYAIASEIADNDPAAVVRKSLAPLIRGKQPAITDLEQAREMLKKAESSPADPVTKLALRLLALTVPRPGSLITTPWVEMASLDKVDPVWKIPADRMKLKKQHKMDESREHWIPLSSQAVDVIEVLRQITGRGGYVFPNRRHSYKPMSENAIGYLMNRAGYHHKHVPHGWRTTFSTIMNERYPADRAVIDLMLAHVPKDKVESAYNRAAYMPRRRELAQLWADLLLKDFPCAEALKTGPQR